MKRLPFIVISLFCLLICSCKKEPQDLLLGSWEVQETVTLTVGSVSKTQDIEEIAYYTFEKNGIGRITAGTNVRDFTYQYLRENNTIRMILNGSETLWTIDALNNKTFVLTATKEGTLLGATFREEYVLTGKQI